MRISTLIGHPENFITITNELPIVRWSGWPGEPILVDGAVDRLVHNNCRHTVEGDSMRKHAARFVMGHTCDCKRYPARTRSAKQLGEAAANKKRLPQREEQHAS